MTAVKTKMIRDRFGMSTVEFALLLPFFFLTAALLFATAHFFYRTVCEAHAVFSAARRVAVGRDVEAARDYILDDYKACSIPEIPIVEARLAGANPGCCGIRVSGKTFFLGSDRQGGLFVSRRQGAPMAITAAGAATSLGGDNE